MVENLQKTYKDGTKALNRISFRVDKGITAILGRNGAGKTTLTRILSTQLLPTSGKAYINGIDVVKDADRIRESIVSIPQEGKPIGLLTPMEHIIVYLCARGIREGDAKRLARKALNDLDIIEEADKVADDLSGGTKRKIFVAMALAAGADTIFLDEPTTGLDPLSRIEVWHAIKKIKGTILLTTHYVEEAKALADSVILVDSGKVLAKGKIGNLIRPYSRLVRIEGIKTGKKTFKLGNLDISYVSKKDANKYIGKDGIVIRNFDLEDIFIMQGAEGVEKERNDGREDYVD